MSLMTSTNPGVVRVRDFLQKPETVHNMAIFSDLGLPALSGIAHKLEELFANDQDFPLSDFRNRQSVGRMVKAILNRYGYDLVAAGLDRRAQLQGFTKAEHFLTSAVYEKKNKSVKTPLTIHI